MSSQVFRAHLDCDAAKEMTFLLSHCRPTTSPVKTVTNYYSQNKRWFSIPLGKVRGSCIEIKSLFLLLYFLSSLFPSPSLLQWLCRVFFALKNIWCTCVKCKNRTKSRKYFGLELSPSTFLEYSLNGQVSPRPQYGGSTLYILSSVCYWLSHVWLFVTPWIGDHQSLLSMGIFQARTLEWVAISFSKGSSRSTTLQADSEQLGKTIPSRHSLHWEKLKQSPQQKLPATRFQHR